MSSEKQELSIMLSKIKPLAFARGLFSYFSLFFLKNYHKGIKIINVKLKRSGLINPYLSYERILFIIQRRTYVFGERIIQKI